MPKASRLASCRAGPPTGLILAQSLPCATSYLGLTRSEPSSKLGAQNACLTGLNESGLGVAFNILGVPLPAPSSPPVIGYVQPFQPSQNDRCPLAAEPQRPSQGPRGVLAVPGLSWGRWTGCSPRQPTFQAADIPGRRWQAVGDLSFPVTQVPGRGILPAKDTHPLLANPSCHFLCWACLTGSWGGPEEPVLNPRG